MLSSAQLKEAFDKYDKDKSGTLEMDEVVKLASSLGAKTTKNDLEDLFKSIDVDRDNRLSFNEFLAWYRVGKHSKLANLLKYQLQLEKGMQALGGSIAADDSADGYTFAYLAIESARYSRWSCWTRAHRLRSSALTTNRALRIIDFQIC